VAGLACRTGDTTLPVGGTSSTADDDDVSSSDVQLAGGCISDTDASTPSHAGR